MTEQSDPAAVMTALLNSPARVYNPGRTFVRPVGMLWIEVLPQRNHPNDVAVE